MFGNTDSLVVRRAETTILGVAYQRYDWVSRQHRIGRAVRGRIVDDDDLANTI